MAADWKNWRSIVVGGQRFRWQPTLLVAWDAHYPDPIPPDYVRVRSESNPNHFLHVTCGVSEIGVVTPGIVRAWIEAALSRGWPERVPQMQLIGVDGSRCPLVALPFSASR
jgi:hypothetical protein